MDSKRLRERAQAILRDNAWKDIELQIQQGDIDLGHLLEELHAYHAELVLQNEALVEGEKVAQRALTRFNRFYRDIPLPTFVIDRQGLLLDANSAARTLLAMDQQLFRHLAMPGHHHELEKALHEAAHEGSAERFEIPVRGAGGGRVIADFKIIHIPNTYDEDAEFVCSMVDQTAAVDQRRTLEGLNQRLREVQECYRILAQFSTDWDYWMGEDNRFRYVSPACKKISGYPAQAFLDDPGLMLRIIHPNDRLVYEGHQHEGSEDSNALLHFRIITQSGDVRWIEHDCRSVWDASGRYRGHRGTNRDITARHQAEAALQRNEAALTQLLDNVPEISIQGYWLDGTTFYWNAASERLYGYCPDEAVGTNLADLIIPPEQRQVFFARMRDLREGGTLPPSEELNLRHRDGHLLRVLSSHIVVEHAPNDLRLYCMDVDLTARLKDQERLWEAVQGANVGLFEWRPNGEVFLSHELKAQLGYRDHEMEDDLEAWRSLIHPDERDEGIHQFEQYTRQPQGRFRFEVRMRHQTGQWRWILHQASPVHGPDGHLRKILGSTLDITERKLVEEQSKRLAYAVEQSPGVVVLTDTDGVIEYVNQRFCDITGFSREEVLGQRPGMLRYGEKNVEQYEALWATIRGGETWEGEFNNRTRSGEPYWEQARISPIRNARGEVTHYIKLAEDISDKRALTQRLEYLAFHDPLTGLPNRSVMLDRIDRAIAQARRDQQTVAVVFIDLDDFKVVNDSLGHAQGDQLLIHIAQRLRTLLREEDTVARFGGDEFILLLSSLTHVEDVIPVIEKLQASLNQPVSLPCQQVSITVSIGIAVYPGDSDCPEELVRHADAAMYRAKAEGRRCYHFYIPEMDAALQERMELDQAMRQALEQNEFHLVYQPRVELVTGRALSLEALVRWRHPQWGMVSPGRFIPLAEETGFILSLGPAILREACEQIRVWKARGVPTVPVAVNLSAREFREPGVVERILTVLAETGLDAGDLEIEITESAAMSSIDQTIRTLTELHGHGIRISIDDFGTAYSSLNYLKRLPVHAIKIDRSFVSDMEQDPANHPEDAAIIRAIIGLGETLGLKVIAEGIENTLQRDFLLDHGCVQGQGYLFSRPMPAEEVEHMLLHSKALDPGDS
ncbi:EAL domain-containing protein [Ectothiorhodospira marina]|uniref:cyclic-guanylate-specific phosphodiesterase n=1 Tax=Ectothiorhodospira marina TaxID=1396821 RepID=A0A1H7MJ42_9GAMM|nr:EAL domain-containing protein [Ectothiorhodospira marina]SEL11316.1 PAS domain S-box-containing protein/diguanylate cyclase (GGDEF) domain-containing protein [Ectothiorhodospira marina]